MTNTWPSQPDPAPIPITGMVSAREISADSSPGIISRISE